MSDAESGIKQQDIADEFVRTNAVPEDDAKSWVHAGIDSEFHPTGGYWFPTEVTWGDSTGWVSSKSEIGRVEMIQYPCSDREPVIRGRDELPDWVVNRTIGGGDS